MATVSYGLFPEPSQVQEISVYLARLHDPSLRYGDPDVLNKFKEMLFAKKFGPLLQSILDELPFVFETGDAVDIETLWISFASLLIKLGGKYTKMLAPPLLQGLSAVVDKQKTTRLTILSHMYNLHPAPLWRFNVLKTVFAYAISSKQTSSVIKIISDIASTLKSMEGKNGITSANKRELYDLALEALSLTNNNYTLLYTTDVKYLEEFKADSDVKELAKTVLVRHLKVAKTFYDNNLLELEAVQTLKDTPIFSLFEIFKSQGLAEFNTFASSNSALFAETGLDEEALRKSIRLLSLGTLAHKFTALSFSQVATAIEVEESEVEMWVIEAMASDILKVRMNRPKKLITVRSATARGLDSTDWSSLHDRVVATKQQLASLLKVVSDVPK